MERIYYLVFGNNNLYTRVREINREIFRRNTVYREKERDRERARERAREISREIERASEI